MLPLCPLGSHSGRFGTQTWIRWYFIVGHQAPKHLVWKIKQAEAPKNTDSQRRKRTDKAIWVFPELPSWEKKKGRCHTPMPSQTLRPWWSEGLKSASFPRGCGGNAPARVLTLYISFPKPHKQILKANSKHQACLLMEGHLLRLWNETWNLSPFMFRHFSPTNEMCNSPSWQSISNSQGPPPPLNLLYFVA